MRYGYTCLLLMLLSLCSAAQQAVPYATWDQIEAAIGQRSNLQDVSFRVSNLLQRAVQHKDWAEAARCYDALLRIADQRSEDTLYFRNARFIDSILEAPHAPVLLQAVMHLLKAERIATYRRRFFFRNNKTLVGSYSTQVDYAGLSLTQLDSMSIAQYEAAFQLAAPMPPPDVNDLLWLVHDPLVFLFKPDFTDLIFARRLPDLKPGAGTDSGPYASWLSRPPGALFRMQDTAWRFDPDTRRFYSWYQRWALYHGVKDPGAYDYIESLARKTLYSAVETDTAAQRLYGYYLQQLLHSPYAPVRVHGVFQLALRWNTAAAAYNPAVRDNWINSTTHFDTSKRSYYNKVLDLYASSEKLLDSFVFVKNTLVEIKQRIEEPQLRLRLAPNVLPGAPVPALVEYRNLPQFYWRIVRIPFRELRQPAFLNRSPTYLLLPPVKDSLQTLPAAGDHQWHNAFIKLDALAAGTYALVYSDSPFNSSSGQVSSIRFSISNIAVMTNHERVYALDRKTGLPLPGALVSYTPDSKKKAADIRRSMPGPEGYLGIQVTDRMDGLVSYQGDSTSFTMREDLESAASARFGKDEDDSWLDYYEDKVRLHLFTDRSIYRPGQRVYFKGIFTIPDPRSGKEVVLNWRNLRIPFYQKIFYRLVLGIKHQKIELGILDPFNHQTDTIRVLPNKFGSVSGSFLLPADAPTGGWSFDTDLFDNDDQNSGDFRVEEYKRPAFELRLSKPEGLFYLGDPFTVKSTVVSFAGAQLSQVKLRYKVTRAGNLPMAGLNAGRTAYTIVTLAEGETYTDEKGSYRLLVSDSTLVQDGFSTGKIESQTYEVEMEAIDATGESHEEEQQVTLSNRPVRLGINMPQIVERSELAPLYVSAEAAFASNVKMPAEVRIYRTLPGKEDASGSWPEADVWIYPLSVLESWFPAIDFRQDNQRAERRELIYTDSVIAGDTGKLKIPRELLQAGDYTLEMVARSNGRIWGENTKKFSVFDKEAGTWPFTPSGFHYLPASTVHAGEPLHWMAGIPANGTYSVYQLSYFVEQQGRLKELTTYEHKVEKQGLQNWTCLVPRHATGQVLLTHLFILNGAIAMSTATVQVATARAAAPEIVVEQYQRQMVPGSRQQFSVSVRSGSDKVAAELMTTLYDASLDKLEEHHWNIPYTSYPYRNTTGWNLPGNIPGYSRLFPERGKLQMIEYSAHPIWWMRSGMLKDSITEFQVLSGRVPGLSVLEGNGLDDVVVVGYGTSRRALSSSVAEVRIRGTASLQSFGKLLTVLDGVVYEGELSNINPMTITDIRVLKGADASAIYGSRAAAGVLIISTKGPVKLPGIPDEPPPPVVRKNFAETAFFFPQLRAGKRGLYTFRFTLPESVTTWNWKMMAHTTSAGFAYAEKTLNSQLPLMVQPFMPRYLYQGDRVTIRTRITNLDTAVASGQLRCRIEDAATGQNITEQLLGPAGQAFRVSARSNTSGAFSITVPPGLLHPLRIIVTGATATFSDGEEYVVPVLARKVLVTRSVLFQADGQRPVRLEAPAMPEDAEPYGIGLSIAPKPTAALLNSLPYLASYPYGCSEQTTNKLLAYGMATWLVRTDSTIRKKLAQTLSKQLPEPSSAIPGMADNAMPWLALNNASAQHQSQLRNLLDTLYANKQQEACFRLLTTMQREDGGISWFKGGKSSDYFSCYALAGLGRMQQGGMLALGKQLYEQEVPRMVAGLVAYCDGSFLSGSAGMDVATYLYSREFWAYSYPFPPQHRHRLDSLLKQYWSHLPAESAGRQAMMITATLRYAGPASDSHSSALAQLESIRQLAISDDSNGLRWKTAADASDLSASSEEWIALIAEAFETGGGSTESIKGILKWLMTARQEHHWRSTKATAAVINLVSRHSKAGIGASQHLSALAEDRKLQVTNDLFQGEPYTFSEQRTARFAGVTVSAGEGEPASGGVSYYYFTSHPPVDSGSAMPTIIKRLFRFDAAAQQWVLLLPGTALSIADKIRTELVISNPQPLQYVMIDDKRAAALDASDGSSGYVTMDGLQCYREVRDASMLFFVDQIPAGRHTLRYETVVTREGIFNNGFAFLQCIYQPAVQAYSAGASIEVSGTGDVR